MSVGYSTYSLEMFRESDVTVSFHIDADIKVNDIKELISLLNNGKHFFHVAISMVSCVIYECVILLAVLTMYEILCYKYINMNIEVSMVWIMCNVFMLWGLATCVLTVIGHGDQERQNPAKYTAIKKLVFRHYFLLGILKAVTYGVVIALSVFFILPKARISEIFPFDKSAENIIILIEMVSITMFRHLMKKSMTTSFRLLIVLVTYVLLAVSLLVRELTFILPQFNYLYSIFLSYSSVVLMANSLLFNIAVTYFYDQVIRNMAFPLLADPTSHEHHLIRSMKEHEERNITTHSQGGGGNRLQRHGDHQRVGDRLLLHEVQQLPGVHQPRTQLQVPLPESGHRHQSVCGGGSHLRGVYTRGIPELPQPEGDGRAWTPALPTSWPCW